MQIKHFVWNERTDRFENVSESMFREVRNEGVDGYINNTIVATKATDDESSLWQFDVELGGAFGRVIAELVRVVTSLQGAFFVPASGLESESGMGFGSSNTIDAEARKAAILALTPPRGMGFGSHDEGSVEQDTDGSGFGIKDY